MKSFIVPQVFIFIKCKSPIDLKKTWTTENDNKLNEVKRMAELTKKENRQEYIRAKTAKKVTLVGFVVNVILTIFKIFAGIQGKSAAMLADGIHSLSDFFTDIVVLVGFKFTEKRSEERR